MAHQIEEHDLTFSTSGAEWHGLAVVKAQEEMPDAIGELFFPIVEGQATLQVDGETVPLLNDDGKGWKVIAADCRNLPRNPGRKVHPPAFVPLHIPKQGYQPITNQRVFEAVDNAFSKAGIAYNLATAGTLGNLSRFYFSIAVDGLAITCPRGFDIASYITALTSHNGMHDFSVMDSHIKPVCANTVNAIMRNHGDLCLKVRHTLNANLEIVELEKTLTGFFTGAADLTLALGSLEASPLSHDEMHAIATGYFALPLVADKGEDKVSRMPLTSKARNAVAGIVNLARVGKGNTGRTAYDLMNGATDYWSNGAGVGGDQVSLRKKAYRSQFGSAADHKRDFTRYLMDDDKREAGRVLGAKVWETTLAKAEIA